VAARRMRGRPGGRRAHRLVGRTWTRSAAMHLAGAAPRPTMHSTRAMRDGATHKQDSSYVAPPASLALPAPMALTSSPTLRLRSTAMHRRRPHGPAPLAPPTSSAPHPRSTPPLASRASMPRSPPRGIAAPLVGVDRRDVKAAAVMPVIMRRLRRGPCVRRGQ
jgi:hypothetical protein